MQPRPCTDVSSAPLPSRRWHIRGAALRPGGGRRRYRRGYRPRYRRGYRRGLPARATGAGYRRRPTRAPAVLRRRSRATPRRERGSQGCGRRNRRALPAGATGGRYRRGRYRRGLPARATGGATGGASGVDGRALLPCSAGARERRRDGGCGASDSQGYERRYRRALPATLPAVATAGAASGVTASIARASPVSPSRARALAAARRALGAEPARSRDSGIWEATGLVCV